jgi:hypothetical protein
MEVSSNSMKVASVTVRATTQGLMDRMAETARVAVEVGSGATAVAMVSPQVE